MQGKEVDQSNMRQVILDFPKQFKKGLEISENIKIEKPINKIVISGMGGSALSGDLLGLYLKDITIPIEVNRDYNPTTPIDEKTLVFCISFSGNTEETITSYRDAKIKGAQIVIITYGGKLKEIASEDNIPLVKLIKESSTFQPRCATGYIFTSLVSVLVNSGIIQDKSEEILEMADNLKRLALEDQGKDLARDLVDKTIIIYTSNRFKALAKIWKIKFNENSKIQAFWNNFPELNHNEMVGFTNPQSKFHIIILKDKDDHPRIQKRMVITADLLKSKGIEVTILELRNEDLLTKIFSSLVLADWISYYLALEYGVDPTPVELVEDFKKKMVFGLP